MHKDFIETEHVTRDQFIMDLPCYKHKRHEIYLSQYNFPNGENLSNKGLWSMRTVRMINGIKLIDHLIFSEMFINDEFYIDQLIKESLGRCRNYYDDYIVKHN